MNSSGILKEAAETINRLGAAAQDCKSCKRLPICNAYKDGDIFKECDYKWIYAEAIEAVHLFKEAQSEEP